MRNLFLIALGVLSLASCKPQQKTFEEMSKNSQEYRQHNGNKKLIPYLEDVYEGKD